jgi:bacterioferritin-associated ferredoxin
MVACVCKGISDGALRGAVASGATLDEVVRATGVGQDCGCCAEEVVRIVAEARPPPASPQGHGCRPGEPACPDCPRAHGAAPRALEAA